MGTKKHWIYWLMIAGVMIANASGLDGYWTNVSRSGEIREIRVHESVVELFPRHEAIERLEGERIGKALAFVRPRRGRAGALMVLRQVDRRRLELRVRAIGPDGRLGRKRVFRFHRAGTYGLRPYLGEWRLRESIPGTPVHIRISKYHGKPYVEAWRSGREGEESLVRKYGTWSDGRIVLKWRDRRGMRQKAVIEGLDRGRRGFYRRIRVRLYRPEIRYPSVYHLEREKRVRVSWRY